MTDAEANKKLKSLLAKADDLFEKGYSKTEARILLGYKRALDDIKLQLSDMYEKYNGKPTITELRKFKRLDALEKKITEIIANMQKIEINTIHGAVKDSLVQSFDRTGFAMNTATGLDFAFTQVPKESIDFVLKYNRWYDNVKNNNAKLLTDVLNTNEKYLRGNASQEIATGLAEGKSYASVTKAIKERFDITATRAKGITYDQMHAGHMTGRNEGIKTASKAAEKLGIETDKVWKHNPGAKEPRPDHLEMNGVAADKDGIFTLPDGTKTEAPGLTGLPEHDIYCRCGVVFQIRGLE